MATYTMELHQLENKYGIEIFDFRYPFYSDDEELKRQFEELFINRYYFHEIGCETPDRWKQMLKAKLMRIMPYYAQLYQTEWYRVGKDMMNSKDLTETTTHTLTSHQLGSQEQQATSESTAQSEGSGEGTTSGTDLESALENGVPQVHLESDLTRKAQSDSNSSTSTQATSSSQSSNESTLTNQQQNQLEEKTTFTSKGDIGIQTPAYAITEWRKVLININEMILDECKDLFILIY